jgi:hypothetical protein
MIGDDVRRIDMMGTVGDQDQLWRFSSEDESFGQHCFNAGRPVKIGCQLLGG